MMSTIALAIVLLLPCFGQLVSGDILRHNTFRCLAPKASDENLVEGTPLVHSPWCTDRTRFFKLLPNGAIQHESSGLCVQLTGKHQDIPKNNERAVLGKDCSDAGYLFKYENGTIRHIGSEKCLRPRSKKMKDGIELIISSQCTMPLSEYTPIDITKGCDLGCLEKIVKAYQENKTFDEYFDQSVKEGESLSSVPDSFFTTIKTEIPELYKDMFSTSSPIDPRVLENLNSLVNHFGMQTVKDYPSLFLSAAYIRRNAGVEAQGLAPCGGTGSSIGGMPVIDDDDADFKSHLSENELKVLRDDEDRKAREAIDNEREIDEANGINTDEFIVSALQKWIDHLDSKEYYKLWTNESRKVVQAHCGFSSVDQIKFPPRGFGMSAIGYIKYYLSRNQSLFPQNSLHFPWPLSIALKIDTSLRECNWLWRRLENGERIYHYSKYGSNYTKSSVRCKESDWNICSIPRIIEDGGVCGRQSQLARVTNRCLGIPSGGIKQPAHAALYSYTKIEEKYGFRIKQGITHAMRTFAVWNLMNDGFAPARRLNVEYHKGLAQAMNYGYPSYRDGRIALLVYSRIYDETKRREARELLIEALERNPHMMDIWMKLIHDISGNRGLPVGSQNIFQRLPRKCPEHFPKHQRDRLLVLMKKHLSSYMQMYLEVLLRLLAPPSCCTGDKLEYLNTLKEAVDTDTREIVKAYLFEGYAMCAAKSSTIQDFLTVIKPRVLELSAVKKDEAMEAFSDIMESIDNFIRARGQTDISENSADLKKFYSGICGSMPRLHVTDSAWVVLKPYKICADIQLKFLKTYFPHDPDHDVLAKKLQDLEDDSAKSPSYWLPLYNENLLYGLDVDIVPLLTGVKISEDGGGIKAQKVNIARGASVSMSSELQGKEGYRAVDGGTDNNIGGGSCASTKKEKNPWFRVDLGSIAKVHGLLISNAKGKHGRHLHGFEIRIGNDLNEASSQRCGSLQALRPGETQAIYCNPGVSGRYVTIKIPGKTVLTLCEVEVFSSQLTGYRPRGVIVKSWKNINGGIAKLGADTRYPDNPSGVRILETIEIRGKGNNNFADVISTFYRAPETGSFVFEASCDDQCIVQIHDMDGNTVATINVKKHQAWNKFRKQEQRVAALQRGNFYKIVAKWYNGYGSFHILLGVTSPNREFVAPIPAKDLFFDTSGGLVVPVA